MARSQAKQETNGVKRELAVDSAPAESSVDRPAKKTKLLDDSDDEADGDDGGISLKINEDYARRFEHNKKREEQHRLEEKYGKNKALQEDDDDSEDSQEGVEEDDDGELVTEDLDQEISATLAALRSKDPRIYDSGVKFFKGVDGNTSNATNGTEKQPSMTLRDYHTKNLLEGNFVIEEDKPLKTHAQEQEEVRQNLVNELKAADEDEEDDDFLVAKSRTEPAPEKRVKITVQDVENADKDPETFLSNFMASRAWVPKGDSRFQPLESDDEDEEAAAEEWENSYNMYFEDTAGANEKLVTYARDAVAATTVRREGKSRRAKAREAARAKREAERREKEEELARLRKLKMDEMEQKVQKIRQIGGLKGRDFKIEEWKDVLEADWSDDQWDREMQKRFGDAYYEDADGMSASEEEDAGKGKKKKVKKPKFEEDIDIKDLIPEFRDDDDEQPQFTLTDDEDAEAGAEEMDVDGDADEHGETSTAKKSSKQRKQERADAKSAARRDRRLIENIVNDSLQYEAALAASSSKAPKGFRYRETSPTTFGMTPRDILLASDKKLNEFAGLKKLATFRDPAKKKKDKKQLSKKARLRQWRQDTFGDAEGPKGGFETIINQEEGDANEYAGPNVEEERENIRDGERKKKRKRKGKKSAVEA